MKSAAPEDARAVATAHHQGCTRGHFDHAIELWPRRGTLVSWNVLAMSMLREAGVAPTAGSRS
ncbi:MAG TPA: hypothetical protein VFG69_12730 [Nannocystaceae bacterium]|nr:hypothetical protein [Nannocystaceae bacterium]